MPIESTKIPKFSRLRRAYCAAGDFCGFRVLLRPPQAKILWFQRATKGILPYKISTVGENFVVLERYKWYFRLQNERRRRNFCDFRELLRVFYLTK